jgi:transcriptional regulator with XRE-family HTH domain
MTNPVFVPYRIAPETEPIMRELFRLANQTQTTRKDLAKRSGVGAHTIAHWERGTRGRIDMVGACFEALGYELAPRRMAA